MKIGIDPGKFGIKAVSKANGRWNIFYLRSKFTKNPENVIYGENYIIKENNGGTYLFGEGGSDYSLDTDKESIQHRLGTYISINQLAFDTPVEVVVGCPFSTYKNGDKKEKYRNYIKSNGIINCEINHIKNQVYINEVVPFPECGGIAYAQKESEFAGTIRGVLDIGGLNINGCLFENLNPVKGSDFTENLGFIILKDKIRSELNKIHPEISLQDYEVSTILKEGLYIDNKLDKVANSVIQSVIENHFSQIIKVMKKKGWSTRTLKMTVGGGGSLDIGIDTIKKFIPQSKISDDPIWDNAKGNYVVAEMLFE